MIIAFRVSVRLFWALTVFREHFLFGILYAFICN